MHRLTLKGKASKQNWQFDISPIEREMSLLEFLETKEVPVASSCRGKGICQKCVFNKDQLACQVKVELIKDDIEVDYL